MTLPILVHKGRVDAAATIAAMRAHTDARIAATAPTDDEIWLCEHPPVYTQGLAGRPEHLREPGDIPVIQTNRGGQVTYHGPGQVVVYPLIDLKRLGIYVKE
jgi:lipoyl(octanoyl) transferase